MKRWITANFVSPFLFLVFPSLRISVLTSKSKQRDRVVETAIEAVPCRTRVCQERASERAGDPIRLQGIVSFALGCVRRADMYH